MDGELFVVESLAKVDHWPQPQNQIMKTPYRKWMQIAHESEYITNFLPLSAEYRAKFNETAAIEFFKSVEGTVYGYNNFVFGWLDTPEANYPFNISSELMTLVMVLMDRLDHPIAHSTFLQALNNRLGTKGLRMQEIINQCISKNITLGQLLSLVELDSYKYETSSGVSLVCSSFVIAVYKAAGLFAPFTDRIQGL